MFFKTTVIALISAFLCSAPMLGQQMQMEPASKTEDRVVATVDGEEIHMSQLQEAAQIQQLTLQMMQINPQFGQFLQSETGQEFMGEYEEFVLRNLIDETLLAQKAGREGIEVSQDEIDEQFNQHLQQLKSQHDLSEDELEEALEQQGISSMKEYKEIFVEQSNLEEQKLLEESGVEEADLQEYVESLREEAEIEIQL